jgi:hypothetical protein
MTNEGDKPKFANIIGLQNDEILSPHIQWGVNTKNKLQGVIQFFFTVG